MTETPGRLARFRDALTAMVQAVVADHETQRRFDGKYGKGSDRSASIAGDFVRRIGFQLSTAYRVMRFFDEAGVPLAPQVMSRVIRHAYGSDIHWKARIEPGVVIVHGMGLAISHAARVGRGVLLFQNVTLGASVNPETRESGAPTIEDDVHVGPGAVVLGPVTIGARSKIMANCVVIDSVPADSLVEVPTSVVGPRTRGRNAKPDSGSRSAR